MEANFVTCADSISYHCLLCPNKIPKELIHKQNAGNAITISLKVLFKYLDIDVRRLALTSGGSGFEGVEEEGISIRLCERCSALANLFEEIHEDFETARLLLIECVSRFMGRVKAASKMSSGTDGDHLWRAEILKQCGLHLQKVPKEELDMLSSDRFDSDSSIGKWEEMSFEDQTATESISSVFELITTTTPISSSTTVQNGAVPSLEEEPGVKPPVGKLDDEMDQILKSNEDLIRRLSDVVSRTKFARQSTSTPTTTLTSTFTTSTFQEVASPNVCLICGLKTCSPQATRNHMMVTHPTSFFSEHFPPGTTEDEVAQVVSKLCQTSLATAGKGRSVNCKLCGGIQIAPSMKSHLLKTHLTVVISALKSNKGSVVDTPPPVIQFPASSESSVERLRIQRLAAKLSGRAKLKCRLCGQLCLSKQGLTSHTRHTHPPPNLKAPNKMTRPSKPANPAPRHTTTTTTVAAKRKLPTCRYCSATYGTQTNCHRHMLLRHPLQYWAGRLPPSTKQEDLSAAIKMLEERHLSGSVKNKVNCRLCSRVCGESSKAFHLLDRHPTEVLATLKSLVEGGWKIKLVT